MSPKIVFEIPTKNCKPELLSAGGTTSSARVVKCGTQLQQIKILLIHPQMLGI